MTEPFQETINEVNEFCILYKNIKISYDTLYEEIQKNEQKINTISNNENEKKDEEANTISNNFENKKDGNNKDFVIFANFLEFLIIKKFGIYYIFSKEQTFMTNIIRKITIINSENTKRYTLYNLNHIKKFLEFEKLDENKISLLPKETNIKEIFMNKNSDKYTVTNIKDKTNFDSIDISNIKLKFNSSIKLKDFILKKVNYVKFNEESEYYESNERYELINKLKERKYSFLCGPSGVGKTVTLLSLRAFPLYNVLYFNLKSLSFFSNRNDIKERIIIELSYCFDSQTIFNDFIKTYIENNEDEDKIYLKNNIDIIQYYLIKVIKNYKIIQKYDQKNRVICIILDQYKLKYDPNCALDNLLKTFINNIHYIKCSSMNEENVRNEFDKYLFEQNDDILFVHSLSGHLKINSEEKKLLLMNLGYFPKYVEEIESYENEKIDNYCLSTIEQLVRKIKNTITDKSNIYNMQIYNIITEIIEKEGIEIPRSKFKILFKYLPLKYIYPMKHNNNKYSFHYSFKLLGKIFSEIKKKIVAELTLNYFEVIESGSKAGFVFEEIVQSIFQEGKPLFGDKNNVIKKEIYVNSIYNLNEVIFASKSENKNIKLKENNIQIFELNDINDKIKLFQEEIAEGQINTIFQKPCGEYYDIAILIPTKRKKKREFDMFLGQITLDKEYSDFIERTMIINSLNQIKKRFETIFNIELRKFYFSYILEKNKKGRNKIETYCNEFHNRLYYTFFSKGILYSKDADSLFSLNLMKKNCLISKLSLKNISYNLNSSQTYKTLMKNSLKIIFKSQSNFEYTINESEKNDIIKKTNLLCELNNGEKIKTLLKKKRNKKDEKDEEERANNENIEIKEIMDDNIQNKQIIKKNLKKEGTEMHKNNQKLIQIDEPGEEEKKIFILENKSKKKVYSLGNKDKNHICKILELQDSDLKIIERGTFFPLNICGIAHYFILYYNKVDNKTKIIVNYSENDSNYKYWDLEKCTLLEDKDGFEFLNLLNNPISFFKTYSSYLIALPMKDDDEKENDKYFSDEDL